MYQTQRTIDELNKGKVVFYLEQVYQTQRTIDELNKGKSSFLAIIAKMTSRAIFQYNVSVIDIDNTTLGLI